MIEGLEKLLASGKDSPELRFGLGNAYLSEKLPESAETHLQACVDQKPSYTAGWKLLAKAIYQQDRLAEALQVYQRGVEVAESQGDIQAQKEMNVFIKRIEKQLSVEDDT